MLRILVIGCLCCCVVSTEHGVRGPRNVETCKKDREDISSMIQKRVGVNQVSVHEDDKSNGSLISLNSGADVAIISQDLGDARSAMKASGVAIQGVHVKIQTGEGFMVVKFEHDGKQHAYELLAHSVYTEDAKAYDGDTLLETEVRTYRLREQGKWASMTLHEDGTIRGLCEHEGRVMEVTPLAEHDPETVSALLESYAGDQPPHLIRWVEDPQLGASGSVGMGMSILKGSQPEVSFVDTDKPVYNGVHETISEAPQPHEHVGDIPHGADADDVKHMPSDLVGDGPIEEYAPQNGTWGGVAWWPGCFPGDGWQHELIVGFGADYKAKELYGSRLKTRLESILNEASFVYEKQMNIKLKIGHLKIAANESDGGFLSCQVRQNEDIVKKKLYQMSRLTALRQFPWHAANHLFTGCGWAYGVLGVAFMGGVCADENVFNAKYPTINTGANKIHSGKSPWLVFAHELGHNFFGWHPFDRNQDSGGIMDYGDGKVNGEYQFNSKFRRMEMCRHLRRYVNRCTSKYDRTKGFFQKDPSAPPPTPPPPLPPAPPCPAPLPGLQSGLYEESFYDIAGMSHIPHEYIKVQIPDVQRVVAQPLHQYPGDGRQKFYTRWTGFLEIKKVGGYRFCTYSQSGGRLVLDGAIVSDADDAHRWEEWCGGRHRNLSIGNHSFFAEFFQTGNKGGFEVKYEGPGIPLQRIPASGFSHTRWKPPPAPPPPQLHGLYEEAFFLHPPTLYTDACASFGEDCWKKYMWKQRPPELEVPGDLAANTKWMPVVFEQFRLHERVVDEPFYEGEHEVVNGFWVMKRPWPGFDAKSNLHGRYELRQKFYARWKGYLNITTAGLYTLCVRSDDGGVLWLDGCILVDNGGHGGSTKCQSIALAVGLHDFTLEYFQNGGKGFVEVKYAGPGIALMRIPKSAFVPLPKNLRPQAAATGLREEGWYNFKHCTCGESKGAIVVPDNCSVPDPKASPNDPGSPWDWHDNANFPDAPQRKPDVDRVSHPWRAPTERRWPGWKASDHFFVRWTGYLNIHYLPGAYHFWMGADEAARLWIDDQEFVNVPPCLGHFKNRRRRGPNWRIKKSRNATDARNGFVPDLQLGLHKIRLEMYETVKFSAIYVGYSNVVSPGINGGSVGYSIVIPEFVLHPQPFNTTTTTTLMCVHTTTTTTTTTPGSLVFRVKDGHCMVDQLGCATSSYFHRRHLIGDGYGPDEKCRLEVTQGGDFKVDAFRTERNYDTLTVNGRIYSGDHGPPNGNIAKGGIVEWTSDNSHQRYGWKLCPVVSPGPATTTTTTACSSWLCVTSGKCKVDAAGCLTSPNFAKDSYLDDEACSIDVKKPGPKFKVETFATESNYDVLTVNGKKFHGQHGPQCVKPAGTILWVADYSQTNTGFKLCPTGGKCGAQSGGGGGRGGGRGG